MTFDIVSTYEDGADIKYRCIDKDGRQCTIRGHKEGEDLQLYIEYTDAKMVYSVRVLD